MKRCIQYFGILITLGLLFTSCQKDENFDSAEVEIQDDSTQHSIVHRNCGLDHYKSLLETDPELREKHEEKIRKFEKYEAHHIEDRAACSNPVTLPIAVHFQGVSSPNVSCLRSLAQSQIDVLNQDYAGTNSDISQWNNLSSHFPGISNGEACIQFALATKNHPTGFGISDGDPAVTINKTNGDTNSSWSGYINIFVQANTGVLGYSPLGGAGNGDGVVIDANAFGLGSGCGSIAPQSPYNLGRTLTHELGHYLLLDHIWGNGCNSDDGVTDTPDQGSEYYDCPNIGVSSCGSKDMFMNYMDYVNDNCMYMFSAGQVTRMENYVNSNLQNVISKAATVLGGTSTGGGTTGGGSTDDDSNDPVCASPSSTSVGNIKTTSATVSWTTSPNAVNYRIRYKKQGTNSWTVRNSTNTTYNIGGLQAATTYVYQVRTRCPEGWKPYTTAKTFTTKSAGNTNGGGTTGGGSSTTTVKLKLVLDYYGSETSWELVKAANYQTVSTGGPYSDGAPGQVINKTWNLADNNYILFVDDSYGDGICCDYGSGSIKILDGDNNVVASSDGNFGTYDYLEFEVNDGTVTFKNEEKDEKSAFIQKKEEGRVSN